MISREGNEVIIKIVHNLIIFVVVLFTCVVRSESCPIEYSEVIVDGNAYQVTWKLRHRSETVIKSVPPCLDFNKNLVLRICSNGTWLPSSKCYHLDLNTICPPGFKELKKKKCVYVTPPQPWNETCPYPGATTEVNDYDKIWLPFYQKIKYGPYEYVLPDEDYGLEYFETDVWEDSDESLEGNFECVVKLASKAQTVLCSANFSRVCVYKRNSFLYSCPKNCAPGGLGSAFCFCKTYTNESSCNLVTLMNTYQEGILNKLVGKDTCLLGNVFENAHLAVNNNRLYLTKPKDGNCAICKTEPIRLMPASLDLVFHANSRKLLLTVYSPEGLFKIDDKTKIFCFTDATSKLKFRVKVDKRFDSYATCPKHRRYKVFKVSLADDGPGYYWCEAFILPTMTIIHSNRVLAYKKIKYNDYSLRIQIQDLCRFSRADCRIPNENFISEVCTSLFDSNSFSKHVKRVKLFRIYEINDVIGNADVLLHISVKSDYADRDEYEMMKGMLQLLEWQNVTIVFFRSSTACLAEVTSANGSILNWDSTLANASGVSKEICVKDNGTPITRRCLGDFYVGSYWEKLIETCSTNYHIASQTQLLNSIALGNNSGDLSVSILDITANTSDLTVLDVHYVSKVLTQFYGKGPSSQTIVKELSQIINNLMHCNSSILKSSQDMLNVTDSLLDIFESALNLAYFTNSSILLINSDIIVHATKPFLNNISGISLQANPSKQNMQFLDYTVTELYSNTTFEELTNVSNIEMAVYVPEKLLNIISVNKTFNDLANITVVTTVFYSDKLFNAAEETDDFVGSKIVGVHIRDKEDYLEEPIPIIFRSRSSAQERKCAFWNYGLRSSNQSGHWSTMGGEKWPENSTEFDECFFSHLTNFALLLRNERNVYDEDSSVVATDSIEQYHDKILSVISNVGCAFSLFGIVGIFLTALLFKSWREKVGTKILMQLCMALFLQVIFLNLATVQVAQHTPDLLCKVIGIVLHYVTIAEFAWMLVAAVLQFYRFVKVVKPMPNRIIMKASIIGWGLPLIPIVITCGIDIQSYSNANKGICYPTGMAMYVGVFVPIVFIIVANFVVFLIVLQNVFRLKGEPRDNSHTILKRQICLAILLFFLLGMPWTFGLISELVQDSWFSYIFVYLFCFTATLQGFVLFVFYVVLEKSTRLLWTNLFSRIF